MGHLPPTEAKTAKNALIARSARSLRSAVTAVGGATVAATFAFAETAAKELTRAERRRRRRERERERDEERDEHRKRDQDDDDDHSDRMAALKARHAAPKDGAGLESPRRRTAQQTAHEDAADDNAPVGRIRTQRQDATPGEESAARPVVLETDQVAEETDPESDSSVVRVGSGDTFASIDSETGTATAESNGVRAIAGPDGAFIEGTPGGEPSTTPTTPTDPTADGNDDGTVDGGNNVDEELLS